MHFQLDFVFKKLYINDAMKRRIKLLKIFTQREKIFNH